MKKTFAILLALVMILSLATVAMADDGTPTTSITINTSYVNGTETGVTYTAYKIFDATIVYQTDAEGNTVTDGEGNPVIEKVSYTIDFNSPYFTTIQTATTYFNLTQVGTSTTWVVEKLDAYDAAAANTFAETLKAVKVTEGYVTTTGEPNATSVTIDLSDKGDGYYLVTSSVGTDLILDTIGNETVDTKNIYPTLDKKVEGKDNYTTADMGEVLTFTIDVTIPEDATGEIVVHDNMTNLEYQSMTAVNGITVSTSSLGDDCAVHFTLSAEYVKTVVESIANGDESKTIEIEYTAKVTDDGASNEARLVNYTYTSATDKVNVYSTDIVINKYTGDADTGTKLPNAKFVLQNADGKYYKLTTTPTGDGDDAVTTNTVSWYQLAAGETLENAIESGNVTQLVTDANGAATFADIADGTYKLIETEAPAGYNLLTEPVEVEVTAVTEDADGNTVVKSSVAADVVNNSGTELPSTGGIGTTIFYIVGGILVVGAAVVLVTKKRMSVAE